jgi:hypothetical protein
VSNSETDLLAELSEIERALADATRKVSEARSLLTEAETEQIGIKIARGRIVERLRVFRSQQVVPGVEYANFDE